MSLISLFNCLYKSAFQCCFLSNIVVWLSPLITYKEHPVSSFDQSLRCSFASCVDTCGGKKHLPRVSNHFHQFNWSFHSQFLSWRLVQLSANDLESRVQQSPATEVVWPSDSQDRGHWLQFDSPPARGRHGGCSSQYLADISEFSTEWVDNRNSCRQSPVGLSETLFFNGGGKEPSQQSRHTSA